jgi:hypothetical protein
MAKEPKTDDYGRVWRGKHWLLKTRLSVYHSKSAGLPTEDSKYHAVCEEHGVLMGTNSIASAKSAAQDSASWCEDCSAAYESHPNTGRKSEFSNGHDSSRA